MIQCPDCGNKNESHLENCTKCGTDLLPGRPQTYRGATKRSGIQFIFGAIGLGIFAWLMIQVEWGGQALAKLLFCGIPGLLAYGLYGLWLAFSPTPLSEKYFLRALRHINIDAQQAESDFSRAIELSPKAFNYYHQRGKFYEGIGRLEDAKKAVREVLHLYRGSRYRTEFEQDLKRITDKLFNDTTREKQPQDEQNKPKRIWRNGRFLDTQDEANEK